MKTVNSNDADDWQPTKSKKPDELFDTQTKKEYYSVWLLLKPVDVVGWERTLGDETMTS